ncbi:MAG: SRPBCC family protein [Actinomycetota bacterium]
MEANRAAPVYSEGMIEIAASAETLWDLMADIRGWPRWNPDVNQVSLQGEVAEGTVFRWKAGPGTITSILRLLDRPRALGWTGRTFGIDAIHVWRFEPRGATTIASMEESFDGLTARLFRRRLQKQLDTSTRKGLENLKAVAEQHSPK